VNHSPVPDSLLRRLDARERSGNKRALIIPSPLLDFCSNDYLGYARSPFVKRWLEERLSCEYQGGKASRLLGGNSIEADSAERFLATYHRGNASLIFPTGYSANVGLLSCIAERGDLILYDERCHASIRDGSRLSYARSFSFRHNNVDHLNDLLTRHKTNSLCVVVVESLYSMDGDQAPLVLMAKVIKEHGAFLIVDEAHTSGIYGECGEGLCVELGIQSSVMARVFTYGKAFGGHGASVVGSEILRSFLINFSRPFIYSTSPPPHFFSTIELLCRYRALHNKESERLHEIISLYRDLAGRYDLEAENGPIQKVVCPGNAQVKEKALFLQSHGIDVRPVYSPTVPEGAERLRVTLQATHTDEQIHYFFNTLFDK
jgi:8-amino-7-oxononanoate synthase